MSVKSPSTSDTWKQQYVKAKEEIVVLVAVVVVIVFRRRYQIWQSNSDVIIRACMRSYMFARIYVCTSACMSVCLYVCMYVCLYVSQSWSCACMCPSRPPVLPKSFTNLAVLWGGVGGLYLTLAGLDFGG